VADAELAVKRCRPLALLIITSPVALIASDRGQCVVQYVRSRPICRKSDGIRMPDLAAGSVEVIKRVSRIRSAALRPLARF
jgi:hypothetical protein